MYKDSKLKRRKVKESRRLKWTANGQERKEKGQEKQPRETPERKRKLPDQPTNLKWKTDLQIYLYHAGSSLAAPRVKRKKPVSHDSGSDIDVNHAVLCVLPNLCRWQKRTIWFRVGWMCLLPMATWRMYRIWPKC